MQDDPKVSKLHLVERETTDIEEVLRYAATVGLATLVVVGMTEDGAFHFDSVATNHEAMWLLQLGENHLIQDEGE